MEAGSSMSHGAGGATRNSLPHPPDIRDLDLRTALRFSLDFRVPWGLISDRCLLL